MLTVGGLFSGIGGWELGLERAGMRVMWHCEADRYCQAVLAKQFPGDPIYDDVRGLRGADVEPVDVLCGGFPCQDLSYAGAGAGIDGERSGLWGEYARLVGEIRPRYVLVENVAALLGRGLGRVLGDLAALGYDAEWDCIPAAAVGAPHLRDRVWLVAYPDGGRLEVSGEPDGGPQRPEQQAPQRRDADGLREVVADPNGQGPQGHRGSQERARELAVAPSGSTGGTKLADPHGVGRDGRPRVFGPGWRRELANSGGWEPEPDVGRVANGIPKRVDRLRALGNALVPQIPELIGRRIIEWERANVRAAA